MSGLCAEAAPAARADRPSPVDAADLPAGAYRVTRMVRFSDCDPAGIGYTPRYVDMLNGVIEDLFLERLGLDYHGLIEGGTGLGYANLNCDFFRPARMGARLTLTPLVDRLGGASANFIIHVHSGVDEIFRGRLVMVTTSSASARPIPLPIPVRAALQQYQEQCR